MIHVVEVGETLPSIARDHGFANWRKVYEHGDNAELRRNRPDPHVLQAGDQVAVPEVERHTEVVAVNQTHRFVLRGARLPLRLQLQDGVGAELPPMRYRLEVADVVVEAELPSSGLIETEVPVGAREGMLTLFVPTEGAPAERGEARVGVQGLRYALHIGALDPVTSHRGLHARLESLALFAGDVASEPNDATARALTDLTGSGDVSERARSRVRDSYGA